MAIDDALAPARLRLAGWLVKVCSAVALLLAALALLGWRTGFLALATLFPESTPLKANAAWGFVLLGIALLLAPRPRLRGIALAASGAAALLALATILEYARRVDLGIDGIGWWLLGASAPSDARMSVLTASALLTMSIAGIALRMARRWPTLGRQLALLAGFLSLLQLTTYSYATRVPLPGSQMSIPSALALLALSVGLLSVRPHEGRLSILWRRGEATVVARRLLPVSLLVPILAGFTLLRLDPEDFEVRSRFGLTLFALSMSAILTGVAWLIILRLDRAEAARDAFLADNLRKTQLLDAVAEGTEDSISIKDLQGRYIFLNAAACRLLGRPAQQLLGTDLSQILDAATLARVHEQENRVIASGRAETRELLIPIGDRKTMLLTEKAPFRDAEGNIIGTIGVSRDITEMKRAEDDLRRAEERLAKVFNASPVGIALSRSDGRFVEVNPAFVELVGRPRDQILSSDFTAYQLWADPSERDRLVGQIKRGAQVRDHRSRVQRGDATLRDVEFSLDLLDVGGETLILTLAADVTEQLHAERQRDEHVMTVAELDRLKRIEDFRADFINSTAHELATPLTPILVDMRLLSGPETEVLPPPQRRALDSLARNMERLRRTAQGVIDASRVQSAQMSLDLKPLDIGQEIGDAVTAHRLPASRSGLDLEVAANGALTVQADRRRLQLILGHLLGNAIKFTPRGGRIRLAWRRVDGQARVEVQDTGPGLDRNQKEQLWRPYSQVHDPMQSSASGSGLGLYVTKNLVALHGGQVGVESAGPGKGSTFWFTLPILQPAGAENE